MLPSIACIRERVHSKPAFTRRQTCEFQVSNFKVFPPKCIVLLLDTVQREDVFNQQERKKLSERGPTFKRFVKDYSYSDDASARRSMAPKLSNMFLSVLSKTIFKVSLLHIKYHIVSYVLQGSLLDSFPLDTLHSLLT